MLVFGNAPFVNEEAPAVERRAATDMANELWLAAVRSGKYQQAELTMIGGSEGKWNFPCQPLLSSRSGTQVCWTTMWEAWPRVQNIT